MGINKKCHDELLNWINCMLPPLVGRQIILTNVDEMIQKIPKCAHELTVKELIQWYTFVRKEGVLK